MAAITAAMVKALREKTDAPMMECKKALTEADGDAAKAEEILRVKLGNKASKAAARVTAEGVVTVYVSEDRKVGAILEVNSETDFVAKNEEFQKMARCSVGSQHRRQDPRRSPYGSRRQDRRKHDLPSFPALRSAGPAAQVCARWLQDRCSR